MTNRWFKPSEKTVRLAIKMAKVAHMPWVVWLLLFLFFIDSYIVVIPIDGVMAAALIFVPDRKRVWYLAGLVGAFLGYLIFYLLLTSSLHHDVTQYLMQLDSTAYKNILSHAQSYGYWYIAWGLLTVIPPIICLGAGLVSQLNPLVIFLMLCVAKVFRLWLVIFLTEKVWSAFLKMKQTILSHRKDS